MGWSFGYNDYKEVSAYLLKGWDGNRCIASKKHAGVLWAVMEEAHGRRWIACHLVKCERGRTWMGHAKNGKLYRLPLSVIKLAEVVE